MQLFEGVMEFVAVAEAGSFVGASEKLGMTKSGVGKAVARLETRLGVRLLHRSTRALSLTDDGRALFQRGGLLLAEMKEVEDQLGASKGVVQGALTINVAVSLGHLIIVPSLSRLLAKFPNLTVDVRLNDRKVDLIDEGVDVAVRFGDLPDSGLVARRLGKMRVLTFASTEYIKRVGMPTSVGELDSHDCIGVRYGDGRFYDWQFEVDGKQILYPARGRITLGSGEAVLAAVRSGAGIAQLYRYMPQPDIESKVLVPVLGQYEGPGKAVSIVYPTHRHLSAKVAAFVAHCTEELQPFITKLSCRTEDVQAEAGINAALK